MNLEIVPLNPRHWKAVREIYAEGIATGLATFETEPPGWEAWDATHLPEGRLVAIAEETVTGWAALSPVSSRCVYEGVAEVSLYVARTYQRRGIGTILLKHLIEESERAGIWTLQAGIFPENIGSIELHRMAGFREIGYREKPGKLNGEWRDVVLMERRSRVVGVD